MAIKRTQASKLLSFCVSWRNYHNHSTDATVCVCERVCVLYMTQRVFEWGSGEIAMWKTQTQTPLSTTCAMTHGFYVCNVCKCVCESVFVCVCVCVCRCSWGIDIWRQSWRH